MNPNSTSVLFVICMLALHGSIEIPITRHNIHDTFLFLNFRNYEIAFIVQPKKSLVINDQYKLATNGHYNKGAI